MMTKLVVLATLILWLGDANARITDDYNVYSPKKVTNDLLNDGDKAKLHVRGGETSEKQKKKKKKIRKENRINKENKDAVNQALQQDAASALGDAIRDRADVLLQDTLANSIEDSVSSIGRAMGSSDRRTSLSDAGGVEVAPASVVVHYFLKSHGGAHALQTLCSVLAAVAGIASCSISNKSLTNLKITLLRRCMIFAMIKHVAGLVGASLVAAQGIRNAADFAKTRKLLHNLATDPVSQYVFYTACVLLWLPTPTVTKTNTLLVTKSIWWQSHSVVPFILAGPVVLRELISSALVVSDVLVLWACSSASDSGNTIKRLLSMTQSIFDAFMSLLVSASIWRSSTASQRQAVLAKLTSKLSLFLELCVGIIFIIDSLSGLLGFLFTSSADRPGVLEMLKRLTCTRLYLRFLYTRRRKIQRLATTIRGGASQVPFYVLSVLMDPRSSMGLPKKKSTTKETNQWTWRDYIRFAFGFDDT